MNSLAVNVNNTLTGYLVRSEFDLSLGEYFFRYQQDSSIPISITMPVKPNGEDYYWSQGLPPIFDMNLPEGALRQALNTRFSKTIAGFDDFDLLSIVGQSQIGRLNIGDRSQPQNDLSFSELLHYDGSESLLSYLVTRYAEQSGISGVQPKILVRNSDHLNESADHFSYKNTTHIIKGWGDDFPELALNEFLCMSLAEKVGLPVPELTLSDNGQFLFVARFDIDPTGQFLGFEDFCVLAGRQSKQKYDGTFEGCTKIIKTLIPAPLRSESLKHFFTSLVLSVAVQNGDAHLKNFGLLYDDPLNINSYRLAPCFDVVSTIPYIADDTMALLLAGTKRWANRAVLQAFGEKHCDLSARSANEVIECVLDAMMDMQQTCAMYLGRRQQADQLVQKLEESWHKGAAILQRH